MYDLRPIEYPANLYEFVDNRIRANPVMLILISIIVLVYYLLSTSVAVQDSKGLHRGVEYAGLMFKSESGGAKIMQTIMWIVFVFLILANAVSYFFNLNIKTAIQGLFTPKPEIDIIIDQSKIGEPTIPEIRISRQVFHVPDNKYTYEEARALCEAYGGTLATYEQIEDAYNKGAEWCGYGWSEGQMALFPTQKETFDKLQTIKGHKHDCGRPGINGGYIANPNVRFGVNCYGYKPFITPTEEQIMAEARAYPITKRDIRHEKKVNKFRNKLERINIAPFNKNAWSMV